jgi:hypothetical protein
MRTPNAIRQKRYRHRHRRRLGKRTVLLELSAEGMELLQKRGYEVGDKDSIGQALSALLSDLVLDEA